MQSSGDPAGLDIALPRFFKNWVKFANFAGRFAERVPANRLQRTDPKESRLKKLGAELSPRGRKLLRGRK